MTYNILGDNQNLTSIIETIKLSQADVVALQELSQPVAQAIRTELSRAYPYQILNEQDSLISRYPITLTSITLAGNWNTPPQIYQLDFVNTSVTLLNAHTYASGLGGDVTFKNWGVA